MRQYEMRQQWLEEELRQESLRADKAEAQVDHLSKHITEMKQKFVSLAKRIAVLEAHVGLTRVVH